MTYDFWVTTQCTPPLSTRTVIGATGTPLLEGALEAVAAAAAEATRAGPAGESFSLLRPEKEQRTT